MREGQIALAMLPQADKSFKNRPVLILKEMPGFGDFMVCGISSQLSKKVAGFDVELEPTKQNGLKTKSIIRLGFQAVLSKKQLKGVLGEISPELHNKLLERLSKHLTDGLS